MRASEFDRDRDEAFVAAVRGRLQHEFFEPGEGELSLTLAMHDRYPAPTLLAVARNLSRHPESRFVALFTIDRATFDEALSEGVDPIAAGELVFVRPEHAALLRDALEDVFPRPETP
jgi:hypothetical protein